MPAKAVNGTTANASDTWRLKIHIHRYVFSIAIGVTSMSFHYRLWTKTSNLGKLELTHKDKLTFSGTRMLGLSNDVSIISIGLKVWSQITSVLDRQTDRQNCYCIVVELRAVVLKIPKIDLSYTSTIQLRSIDPVII